MSNANKDQQIDLPAGWVSAQLEEICQINPPLDRCIVSDAVEVNFVPMRAVEPEGGGLVRPELRTYGEVKKGYTSFLSGDVIMAKITPCMENGKTTVVPELSGSICFGSTEFHVMRPEDGMEARWIAGFLLQHEVRRAAQRAMTGGVGQMRVPAAFLEGVRVPIAPSTEQERIADVLDELFSDLDAGVAALERVRDKLKLYRASVLKAAVEGTLTAEWRKQHPQVEPASELLKRILAERRRHWEEEQLGRFKAKGQEPPKNWKAKYREPVAADTANLPQIPDGWVFASMDAITLRITSGSRDWQQYYGSGAGTFIMAQNVRPGRFDPSCRQPVNPPVDDPSCGRSRVEENDLLVTIVGANTGDVCRIPELLNEHYVCQSVALMRPVDKKAAKYLEYYYNAQNGGQLHYRRYIYGAGRPHLSFDQLKMTPVLIPPLDEQETLIETVEDHFSIIEHLEADLANKLKNAHTLRQAILRHAFTGKLVAQNPNDELASKLLKRISTEREQRAREAAATKRSNGRRPLRASMAQIPGKAGRTVTNETVNGRIADR